MSVKSGTLAVAVAVLSASTAFAQGWHEYISRDEFFLVGMPSAPQITSTTYRAASGAMLPAKQFVATEGQRRYTVTVVHYMNASAADEAAAIEHAVRSFRNRPAQVTYDREQQVEGLPAHMIYLLNPDQSRIAAGVILHPRDTGHGGPGRLYILEGHVPAGAAPAIQFPQSFFLMDENANRLDYVTNAAGQRVRNVRTQQASVSGPYGAREPATCTAADQAQGKPTAAQVAQYIKCTLEGIGDGSLFLIENIQVREIGDAGQLDASFFPDIEPAGRDLHRRPKGGVGSGFRQHRVAVDHVEKIDAGRRAPDPSKTDHLPHPQIDLIQAIAVQAARLNDVHRDVIDMLKVDLNLTLEQLRAITDEAARAGVPVTGHSQNVRKAVEIGGLKYMEHTDMGPVISPLRRAARCQRIQSVKLFVSPTVVTPYRRNNGGM